jgi:hypothetical protein
VGEGEEGKKRWRLGKDGSREEIGEDGGGEKREKDAEEKKEMGIQREGKEGEEK